MNRKRFFTLFVVLIAIGVGSYFLIQQRTARTEWQGYAEADYIKVGPTQPGLLTAVHVRRGDRVAAGAPLFDQDDAGDIAAMEQGRRQLDQAGNQVANLEAPRRQTEIAQAQANIVQAAADRDRLQADMARFDKLAVDGFVTKRTRDQTRADLAAANARIQGLQAALDQMRDSTGRPQEIQAQIAGAEGQRAALSATEWRLDQRHVRAPAAGIVDDVLARAGETLQAGAPVISLMPPGNIFIRFFVGEPMLGQVHRGDRVALACDGCKAGLEGVVEFISPNAEYTPPLIYSDQNRAKLIYMIQARPRADQAMLFNPGQPVTVRPLSAIHQ